MKVRYTRRALRQLAEILDYLDARSPQGAENVKRRLKAVVDLLASHPIPGVSPIEAAYVALWCDRILI